MDCDSCYRTFATSFVAPSYIPYVFHVLKDSKKRGIKRLYFVSRDAYILQRIAEQIPHEGIEYRYLFISRASLERGFFHLVKKNETLHPWLLSSYNKNTDYEDDYNSVLGYLTQEGIFDDHIALVDVGWFGRTRAMINRFRESNNKDHILTYYYGEHQVHLPKEHGDYDCFIKRPLLPDWSTYIIEEFFSRCPYPTTTGYSKDASGRYLPTFPDGEQYKETPFVKANVKACVEKTKELVGEQPNDEVLYAMMEAAHRVLFHSSYVARHKELHPIFNDRYRSVYKFGLHELMMVIRKEEFDYRVNVRTNIELAIGTFGYRMIPFLQKIYPVITKIRHKLTW